MTNQSMKEEILEAFTWAVLLGVVTILSTFISFVFLGMQRYFYSVSNLLLLEFGILLLVGGCLMGRQPLNDEDRYDSEGTPVEAWSRALFGRKALIASLFVLLLAGIFYLFGIAF